MNLGEKLKAQQEAREKAALAAEQLKIDREFREHQRVAQMLQTFIDNTKLYVEEQIGLEMPLAKRRMPGPFNHGDRVDQPDHPYYGIWKDFADWADTNGLKAMIYEEHDGVGVKSWRTVGVEPL